VLKNHWRIIARLERIGDNLLIILAFFLSYHLRYSLYNLSNLFGLPFPEELKFLRPIEEYLVVLGIGLPLFNSFISVLGGYKSMRFSSWWKPIRISIFSAFLVFLCQGSFLYLLKLDLSRSFIGLFCVLSGGFLAIERVIVLFLLRFHRVRGRNFRNLLIVGTGKQAQDIYLDIIKQPELGIKVAGFVDISGGSYCDKQSPVISLNARKSFCNPSLSELPERVIADQTSFEAALKRFAIDEVLFTDVVLNFPIVGQLAEIAADEGVGVVLAADLFSLGIFKSDISFFGAVPLIHYQYDRGSDVIGLCIKRGMDFLISLALIILLSPIFLLVALTVKLESKGPVFFRQRRVGLNGRHFTLLKFRSMVDGAEQLLDALRHKNEMSGPVFKIRNDPRITRVGRFIRRYSIDELPQLFNVLVGDMSLVGPRPPLPEEVSFYERKQRRRLSMRPGITCTWQVSGRNDIPDFEKWANLDLEYIDSWSLKKDLVLLARTVPAVLIGNGAR
jgi:exopolysaccharide biosynthesis polyprenyl glycosylphosphotransferase